MKQLRILSFLYLIIAFTLNAGSSPSLKFVRFSIGTRQGPLVGIAPNLCGLSLVLGTILTEPKFDITQAKTQAIVNPANDMLAHYGGIAEAISTAAGPELQEWSNNQPILQDGKRLSTGKALISSSFGLKQQNKEIEYIIHTVGPDCRIKKEYDQAANLIYAAWYNSLVAANEANITSITFPSISTGIFACSKELAAESAAQAITDFYNNHRYSSIQEVVIGLWPDTWHAYIDNFSKAFPIYDRS